MREVGIVGAGGHVIRRHAGGAQQREVFDIGGRLDCSPVDQIVNRRFRSASRGGRGSAARTARPRRRGDRSRRLRKLAHARD